MVTSEFEQNKAIYSIGVIAELINQHPETIRVWERHGLIKPRRRGGKRFYSINDLKRLRFILTLMEKGLNIPAIKYQLSFYPCWFRDDCPKCSSRSKDAVCSKPCWKIEGTYCLVSENMCDKCDFRSKKISFKR
jgi:MerR family transcriptional regulator/heat shock protein HspR